MNILCVDIGGGTQDILYYTGEDIIENSIKMVLPTPSKNISTKISKMKDDIFIDGTVIGGGSLSKVLKEKIIDGFNIYITRKAAKSIRDNLEYVKKLGITIVEETINPNIIFDEFDYNIFKSTIQSTLGNSEPDIVAIAAQDHGFIQGQSDRMTRFEFLKSFLANGLNKAFFSEISSIPTYFTRWKALAESVTHKCSAKLHISDTAIIAALGASTVCKNRPIVTVDAGNCHTFAALIDKDNSLFSFFEHHTTMLTPNSIMDLIHKLITDKITGTEIEDNHGHGAYKFKDYSFDINSIPIMVTGPNSHLLFPNNSRVTYATPKGDTMLTGPIGLLAQLNIYI